MPRAVKGVLVRCDPSIHAIILKVDADEGHAIIVEDLNEGVLVVKEAKLEFLKARLKDILAKSEMLDRHDDSDDPERDF